MKSKFEQLKQEIFKRLNISMVFPELYRHDKNDHYYDMTCPACKDQVTAAYLYKGKYSVNCNRLNNCGQKTSLFDYYITKNNLSPYDALKELAGYANVPLPQMSKEEILKYERLHQLGNIYKEIAFIAKENLKEGTPVYKYLIETRRYSKEDIDRMGLGLTPNKEILAKKLKAKEYDNSLIEEIISSLQPITHPLYIPLRNKYNQYESYILRAISQDVSNKYFYQKGSKRGEFCQGIGSIKGKELIIVEGFIDQLRLQSLGLPVVAFGGNQPTATQILSALRDGTTRNVYLCLDNDKAGIDGTHKAIGMFREHDVNVYVMDIGKEYKDPDELLTALGNEEGLKRIKTAKDNAQHFALWYLNSVLVALETDTERDTAKQSVYEFIEREFDRLDPDIINRSFELISSKLEVSFETLQVYLIEKHQEKEEARKRATLIKETHKALKEYEDNNDISKLKTVLDTNISKVVSTYATAKDLFSPYSFQDLSTEILTMRDGLKYGYAYLEGKVLIPIGATTLVAGRTSHGKTTFMLNMFINMIRQYPDKKFYFFACEEARKRLTVKILSILIGETLIPEESNYKTISRAIKYPDTQLFQTDEALKHYEDGINEYNELIKAGRLNINYTNLDVDTISGIIKNDFGKDTTGAVFIDHAHAIKFNGKVENETLRLKYISNVLLDTAVTTDLPLIIGVQLNRINPKERPSLENIKQAGAFEEDANVVMGVYNFKTGSYVSKDGELINDQKHTMKKGIKTNYQFHDPTAIDFEVHLLKAREGEVNSFDCLVFNSFSLNISES